MFRFGARLRLWSIVFQCGALLRHGFLRDILDVHVALCSFQFRLRCGYWGHPCLDNLICFCRQSMLPFHKVLWITTIVGYHLFDIVCRS